MRLGAFTARLRISEAVADWTAGQLDIGQGNPT